MADVFRGVMVGLALAAGLSGCGGPVGDQFAPACPQPAVLADAGKLVRYRGAGRDFLDTTLQGQIESVNGSCTQDGARVVATTVSVGMALTRGPAASGRVAEVPFFVAVTRGDRVLDKQVYVARAEFPENTDRVRLSGDKVDLRLPVSQSVHADAYRIVVGFQLTPEELETNRAADRRGQ